MRLPNDDCSQAALLAQGGYVAALLRGGDTARIVQQFGYALAFKRDPAYAVWEDLRTCLEELGAARLDPQAEATMACKYFKPDDSSLFALVEIRIPTDNARSVLVELIVTAVKRERHITLEQVSAEGAG